MVHIVFKARSGNNYTEGKTAIEAVAKFLSLYKNRTLSVTEYRDGIFKAVLYVAPGEEDTSYFYKKFASREEAKTFCK